MTNKTIGLFLLATTFLSSPAGAAALTPTLDTIKSEAADLSGNFALSELTGDLPAGAVEVKIGDKSYYFTPSGDDATLLATLAGTSAGNLKEDANGIFELNGQKYGFDVASIPDSVFEYAVGTKDDYNFTVQEVDAEGSLTDKYYKINLKPDNFATSKSITWTEVPEAQKDDKDDDLSDGKVSAVIAVNLPNNQTKYFQYTYTKPDNYTVADTRIDDALGTADVTNVIFNAISSWGEKNSAIYNDENHEDVNIIADFIGNIYANSIHNDKNGVIGDIIGGFIDNNSAIDNDGTIGDIAGDFIDNNSVISNYGTIGDIAGDFIGNDSVISNYGTIGDIAGDFIGNRFSPVIRNNGATGNITGDFIGNFFSFNGPIFGGVIDNNGSIGHITGDFIGNGISSREGGYTSYHAFGGAIHNNGSIGNITGDFIGNYAHAQGDNAYGGAVYNRTNAGIFIKNTAFHITVKYGDQEIELYSMPKSVPNSSENDVQMVNGTLIVDNQEAFDKYKQSEGYIFGLIKNVSLDDFTLKSYVDLMVQAGAITPEAAEEALKQLEQMPPEEQEAMLAEAKQEIEGIQNAINNATPIKEIDIANLKFYNSSFRNNYVKAAKGEALGGAFYGSSVKITADNYTSVIDGNTANGKNNAFYVLKNGGVNLGQFDGELSLDLPIADLSFSTLNNGVFLLNDGINGESGYGIAMNGDKGIEEESLRTPQYVKLNNSIANAGSIYLSSTTLSLGTGPYGKGEIVADGDPVTKMTLSNAAFDLYNKYQDTVNLKGWKAAGNSFLHVDVDVENLTADMLNINGNVEGTTRLVLYPTSDKDIRGESILFAQSQNDTTGNADSFKVWRVYRSPYVFETKYTKTGENANRWELEMNDTANDYAGVEPGERPDPEVPELPDIPDLRPHPMPAPGGKAEVAPEVIGYQSVTAAAVAQNANLIYNVMNKVTDNRLYCPGCGFYDYYWNGEAFHNLWVNPVYTSLSIKSPTEIDADVWGIEAGGDLQHDLNNKLGLFVSYRKGNYDMNGDGKHYYSTVGSEIDIDSYLAGLYYRYDRNNWYAFATLYGGIQQADIKTDDGVKSDTDGVEFGASLEAGYDHALTDTVYLTPSLGVFYTQVSYDDATDSVGKKAEYNDLRQVELEAGVKLTKAFRLDEGYANVYVKPSVVRTIVDGDEVTVTGLGKVNTLDDETLGRIELGGRYGFTDQLSAYGWANYTFGSDYDATTVGLGLNYAW